MKKWTVFFISIVVFILVAYYVMGFIVKSTLNKNVNSIPKTSVMSVHLDEYQRGWFSSQAIFKLKMNIPAQKITDQNGVIKMQPPVDADIDIPLTIKHGPVIFTSNGIRFGIGQVSTRPETHYGVLVNYFNKTVLNYNLPAFAIRGKVGLNEGDFQLNWQGLSALFSVSSNLDDIDANLKLYGVNGSANNTVFKIGEISKELTLKKHQDWLWVGQSHFDIPSIAISAGGNNVFELKGFDLTLDSEATTEALDYRCELSLQKLFVNNQIYGPGILKLSVKNLDPAIMAKMNQQQLNMLQNNSNSNLIMLSLLAELPKLLAKGAVLELSEMTLNLPEGKIIGSFKLSLPKNEVNDVAQVMQKLHGEGQFRAPVAVVKTLITASIKSDLDKEQSTVREPIMTVESVTSSAPVVINSDEEAKKQTDKILQNMVNKGFLKVEDSDYVLNFKLENQQFIINGQPFNPAMLQ